MRLTWGQLIQLDHIVHSGQDLDRQIIFRSLDGFRSSSPEQVKRQVQGLVARHDTLRTTFDLDMDDYFGRQQMWTHQEPARVDFRYLSHGRMSSHAVLGRIDEDNDDGKLDLGDVRQQPTFFVHLDHDGAYSCAVAGSHLIMDGAGGGRLCDEAAGRVPAGLDVLEHGDILRWEDSDSVRERSEANLGRLRAMLSETAEGDLFASASQDLVVVDGVSKELGRRIIALAGGAGVSRATASTALLMLALQTMTGHVPPLVKVLLSRPVRPRGRYFGPQTSVAWSRVPEPSDDWRTYVRGFHSALMYAYRAATYDPVHWARWRRSFAAGASRDDVRNVETVNVHTVPANFSSADGRELRHQESVTRSSTASFFGGYTDLMWMDEVVMVRRRSPVKAASGDGLLATLMQISDVVLDDDAVSLRQIIAAVEKGAVRAECAAP